MSKDIARDFFWDQGGALRVVLVRLGEELTPGSQSSEQTRNQNPTSLGTQKGTCVLQYTSTRAVSRVAYQTIYKVFY